GILMAGLALHRLGRSAEAEPLLRAALDRMDATRADQLLDIGVFLSPYERTRYRRLPVEERRALEARYWSSRDPSPETAVNERWAEH
ncbi:MAG: hypothetical protein GWN07_12420, partial [Actinobacteria bacterium]|nr:hypothetical protein [Actinomycetota bacterium]NIU66285.1 hypothetical protein [Actinomycetota bacterium]NIW28099.1 hypothetical protein [Actinomycetota bacterium]NIX20587.1 hypothetical protein [Actinomycetota bacterium]